MLPKTCEQSSGVAERGYEPEFLEKQQERHRMHKSARRGIGSLGKEDGSSLVITFCFLREIRAKRIKVISRVQVVEGMSPLKERRSSEVGLGMGPSSPQRSAGLAGSSNGHLRLWSCILREMGQCSCALV